MNDPPPGEFVGSPPLAVRRSSRYLSPLGSWIRSEGNALRQRNTGEWSPSQRCKDFSIWPMR